MYFKAFKAKRRRLRDRIAYVHDNTHNTKKPNILMTIFVTILALISGLIIGVILINGYHLYRNEYHGKKVGLYGKPPINPKINNQPHKNGHGILSVVLPTHCTRFEAAQLTLESLSAYTAPKTFDELILVSPERCPFKPIISKQLSNLFISEIRTISDESLIEYIDDTNIYKHHWQKSTEKDSHLGTWHKQMMLKLAIGFVVQSPFFLILDDDILQISHASLQDFISIQLTQSQEEIQTNPSPKDTDVADQDLQSVIVEQHAISETHLKQLISDTIQNIKQQENVNISRINISYQHHRKLQSMDNEAQTQEMENEDWKISMRANWVYDYSNWQVEWYQNSAKLMQAEQCMNDDDLTFGVTPAILHTGAVRSAVKRMETLDGMNGVGGFWSEYAVYRVEFCLRKDFLKYHSKDPTLDFDKKLYTRYAKELSESSEAIYNTDEALDVMKLHQNNNNIFIVLQDGAVPDKIREQSWNKWIQNEFNDEQRSLFMESRNIQNINNENNNHNDGSNENNEIININTRLRGRWSLNDESLWLRLILIINITVIVGYFIFLSPICTKTRYHEKDEALLS